MEIEIVHSFKTIEDDWCRLYDMTDEVSPFLHPSAFRIAYKYFYPYYIANRCRPIFAVVRENSIKRAIVPLTHCGGGITCFSGKQTGSMNAEYCMILHPYSLSVFVC